MSSDAPHADVGDRFNVRLFLAMLLGAGICASPLLAHAQKNPLRDAFFGETHLHTSWSFDAYVFGNTLAGPEEAYQYALGKPIKHPAGFMVQLKRPLDFQAVTDHSEYMGTVRLAIVVVRPRAASFSLSAAIDSGVTGATAPRPR